MLIEALYIIARTSKQPRYLFTKECIKNMWYIYTIDYCTAIKSKKLGL